MSTFVVKAKKIYGNKFDYSKVKDNKQINSKPAKKINNRIATLICNRCHRTFRQSKYKFLKGKGCKYCDCSKGELKCKESLTNLGIRFNQQKRISSLKRRYYDFIFTYRGEKYILEYDGSQHFIENSYFKLKLKTIQKRDIIKTKAAILEGYKVIRIDYKVKLDEIESLIIKVINTSLDWDLWVSDYTLYLWLVKTI